MKRNIARSTVGLIALAIAVISMMPSAHAQHCSFARAAGHYGFSDSGTIVNVGPRAAVGLLNFNAAGQIKGQVTASLKGAVSQTTLSGTYAVSPDCSGTTTFTELDQNGNPVLTATVAIAWDDNMREARFLFTSVALANGPSLATAINGGAGTDVGQLTQCVPIRGALRKLFLALEANRGRDFSSQTAVNEHDRSGGQV